MPFFIPVLHHPSWVREGIYFLKEFISLIKFTKVFIVTAPTQGESHCSIGPKTDLLLKPFNELIFILIYQIITVVIIYILVVHYKTQRRYGREVTLSKKYPGHQNSEQLHK